MEILPYLNIYYMFKKLMSTNAYLLRDDADNEICIIPEHIFDKYFEIIDSQSVKYKTPINSTINMSMDSIMKTYWLYSARSIYRIGSWKGNEQNIIGYYWLTR